MTPLFYNGKVNNALRMLVQKIFLKTFYYKIRKRQLTF